MSFEIVNETFFHLYKMVKSCVYEDCNSNSRDNPDMKWAPFVKPSKNSARAELWIKNVARLGFEVETITKDTYVCELHFAPSTNLKYWMNPDLTPFPKGQALTQYLRCERRLNREAPKAFERSEPSTSFSQRIKGTYKTDKSSIVKHVTVLSGVSMPTDFSIDLPISTSDEQITTEEFNIAGKHVLCLFFLERLLF